MAEAEPEYLYSNRSENKQLKADAAKALDGKGLPIQFDRQVLAWRIKAEEVSAEDLKAAKAELSKYVGPEAKAAWQADREVGLAEKEALKAEAKSRESTTPEQKPEKQTLTEENSFLMYPAISQKAEFHALVQETQSVSKYKQGNENREAHFLVKTESPEKFAVYMGDDAKARFTREFEEQKASKAGKENTPVEQVRAEAQRRSGSAFMAQYQERGFRLRDPKRDKDGHQKQLDQMRDATTKQLIRVVSASRDLLAPLREKEVAMRAEAANLPVEQVKSMSWADQKAVGQIDGKPVGLVGDDFALNSQLSRGIAAINAELKGRGVQPKNRSQDREQDQARDQGQGQSQNRGGRQEAGQKAEAGNERRSDNSGYSVPQSQSVDNDYALMAAGFARRGQGAGR